MALRGIFKKALVGACAGLFSFAAQAATVQLMGDTVIYEYDDQQLNIDLWGDIDVVGDTVNFSIDGFEAQSIDGTGSGLTDATFVFSRVYGKNGGPVTSLSVTEFGDYRIINGGDVQVDLWLNTTTNPGGGDFAFAIDTDSDAYSGPGAGIWNVNASLSDADFGLQTDMEVKIQNTLQAITYANGETAFIEKKISFTAAAVVPVPAAVWLFGSAILGLLAVGRRRAATA